MGPSVVTQDPAAWQVVHGGRQKERVGCKSGGANGKGAKYQRGKGQGSGNLPHCCLPPLSLPLFSMPIAPLLPLSPL